VAEAALVKRVRLAALVALLLLAGGALAECPACDAATPRSFWPLVGAFMLVPPLLAVTVILLMRREFRSTFGRKGGRPGGAVISFTPLARLGHKP